MKLFKIWVIALIAFNLNTDLFAQPDIYFPTPTQSCDFSDMNIEPYPASSAGMSDENHCFKVSIETENPGDLYISMNGCVSTSTNDDRFSAIVCYGPDACGPYAQARGSVEKVIECGILNDDGGVRCFDGCIVTIEPKPKTP